LPLYARAAGPPGAAPWQLRLWLRGWAGLRRGWEEYRRDAAAPPDRLVFYEAATDYAEAARETDALYAAPFRAAVGKDDPLDDFAQPEPGVATAVRVTRLIADTYLREDGVAQGDRLSMASSVEMRLPLLDYRLVETVIGLRKANPGDHRLAPKTWLREAVRDVLPAWVMDRPKRGFQPPMEAWFRELFRRYGSLLADGYLVGHGVLDPSAAARAATCPLPRGYSSPLCFKALVLEMWCRCVQRLAS
jgi:asparagine synthase (glutamine-hydrolysing)